MRTTQAARYARWSAMVAMLLAASVAGAYVRRVWQERQARKGAPSSVPAAVEEQSAGFSFSKVNGDRTEFTLRAAHATQFAGGDRSLLDDVWVTMYGKDGLRADNLHTRSCEYLESTGGILCAGTVQIDLQSADDARLFPANGNRPNPGAHIAHISTSKVTFNRKDGTAVTDQPVTFRFPQGQGRGVGLRYESQAGELQLLHDVDVIFVRPPVPAGAAGSAAQAASSPPVTAMGIAAAPDDLPLHVCGSSLLYRRDERVIHLQGPALAQQGTRQLYAGQLAVELDTDLRARRIMASGKPKLLDTSRGEPVSVVADELSALISGEGWTNELIAVGNVHATAHGVDREDRMDAGRAVFKMAERVNRPQQLIATQNVVAESLGSGGVRRTLNTAVLTLDFLADGKDGQSRISHAATPEATVDWRSPSEAAASSNPTSANSDPSTKSSAQYVHMVSQRLEANFDVAGELRDVRGTGGVQVERQIGNGPVATSTSREALARTLPDGDWTSVDQTGDVHLRQLDRSAQSDISHFDRLSDTAVLSGSVVLADAQSRVTAQTVTFHQLASEFHAEGHVVSSEVSAQNGGATNLGSGPARISADNLVANTLTGKATYSGQARLWQGDSLIQADTITLDRASHVLTANNHVRAVFPQAAWAPSNGAPNSQLKGSLARPSDSNAKPEFWRAEANRMTYDSEKGRGRLEENVYTHSSEGAIRADAVDLFFAPSGAGSAEIAGVSASSSKAGQAGPLGAKGSSAGSGLGGQQLIRATAIGKVLVEEEDRHGTSSRADYTASEGKFVLSGGPPIVYDASGNSTTGRQLTLFFADDRILIDSAEGLRTLTLHRVEK